jgi:hypothetical protein
MDWEDMKNYITQLKPGVPVFWIGGPLAKLVEAVNAVQTPAANGQVVHILSHITVVNDSILSKYKATQNFPVCTVFN